MTFQYTWPRNAGGAPLLLTVEVDGVMVSGLAPTAEVVRFSDNRIADWASMEFVVQGTAVSGAAVMSGMLGFPGVYRRDFDPDAFGEGQSLKQAYIVRYRATVPSGYVEGLLEDSNLSSHEVHSFTGLPELSASFGG